MGEHGRAVFGFTPNDIPISSAVATIPLKTLYFIESYLKCMSELGNNCPEQNSPRARTNSVIPLRTRGIRYEVQFYIKQKSGIFFWHFTLLSLYHTFSPSQTLMSWLCLTLVVVGKYSKYTDVHFRFLKWKRTENVFVWPTKRPWSTPSCPS